MTDGHQLPVPVTPTGTLVNPSEIAQKAASYAEASQSDNTRKAYASDWLVFTDWCRVQQVEALPASPATVTAWIIDTAGKVAVTTQRRRISAIQDMHKQAGHHLDLSGGAFRKVWAGVRRTHGRPPVKKAAFLTPALRNAVNALPDSLTGIRDRALLLVGFAGAMRRTELAAVEVSPRDGANWIEEGADGLTVHLARSKGDQEGAGQRIGIPFGSNPSTCPVRAYRAWLQAAGITEGPAFRSINRHGTLGGDALCDHSVALVIKRAIVAGEIANGAAKSEAAATARRFAGHSLRSGLATSAAVHEVAGHLIQRQLRHKKYETTSGYIQDAELLRKNAAGMVGL
ncbi:site-specific integrase [Bradyrhizobium manausense]|uniref:site-specific integrase n=1 Tax=Bradyrhizobium manausense TaxID=989370 RepID=UPI0009F8C4C0|nr:site-specific integrase [Bradyrhizobium manausense]